MKEPLVSIIIPVYNVSAYIDRCIQSIVGQTYGNLEIILINDGSTDDSLEKCIVWAKRDPRIVLCSKKNAGLGPTRNLGIRMFRGDYAAFVDSDDWIELDFVEVMLEAALRYHAELVNSNFVKTRDLNGSEKGYIDQRQDYKIEAGNWAAATDCPEVIWKLGTSVWNRLYARSLLKRIEVEQPPNAVEDMCVTFLYMAEADGIVHISRPLYHYYTRNSSLSFSERSCEYLLKSMTIVKENAVRFELPDRFEPEVKKLLSNSIAYFTLFNQNNPKLEFGVEKLWERIYELFPQRDEIQDRESFVWGSFGLRETVRDLLYHEPKYFGFSSLISLFLGEKDPDMDYMHNNAFRSKALKQDFMKSFLEIGTVGIASESWLFLDFMEERFDVLKTASGNYVTKSDAFDEAGLVWVQESEVIKSEDEKFWMLWKQACEKFAIFIRQHFSIERVVLVRMRLAKQYGTKEAVQYFENSAEISAKNRWIRQLEDYFIGCMPQIRVIDLPSERLLYADTDYLHGCFPWHLNYQMYRELGRQIDTQLKMR